MRNIDIAESQNKSIIERNFIIGNMLIHIKSIFNGHTNLDKALSNIIIRKLSETKK